MHSFAGNELPKNNDELINILERDAFKYRT